MDLNLFKVNPSIVKTINVHSKDSKFGFQGKGYNFVYDGNIYFFRLLRILGMFPITRDCEGVLGVKPVSLPVLYTAGVLGCGLVVLVITTPTLLSNIFSKGFTFEDGALYSLFLSFPISYVMLVINVLVSKKMAKYLSEWDEFQNRFEGITERKMENPSKKWMVIAGIPITVSLLTIASNMQRFGVILENYQIDLFWHYFLLALFPYCSAVVIFYNFLWYFLTDALKKSATALLTDIENLRWMQKGSLQGHLHLWLHLRRLCINFGGVMSFSSLYLFLVLFFVSLPMVYVGTILILKGDYTQAVSPIFALGSITIIADMAHRAEQKIGTNFEIELTKLLLSGRVAGYEKELENFIQTVTSSLPFISLGGYFYVNRGINVPLYSSVITYLIIIVQYHNDSSNK